MAGMRTRYGDQLPRADQPLTPAHVRIVVDGVLDLRRHPRRTTFAIPPEQTITEPFVERIGRVDVTIFPDGTCSPAPDEVVRLDRLAHAQRAALDDANHARGAGHFHLTDDERARGLKRPRWHSYQHLACGRVTSLRFDDAVEALARDPGRHAFRLKGLPCACDPNGRPIEGDLRGRPGEFVWADSAGRPTPVKVGS